MANSFGTEGTLTVGNDAVQISPARRCSKAASGCRSRSRCCSRTCCATRTAAPSSARTSRRCSSGIRRPSPTARSPSRPARVLLQDFTGVPVRRRPRRDARRDRRDWAATRSASTRCVPVDLVIDHSVQVDSFGTREALRHERRARVRAQPASATRSCAGASRRSSNFRVVPPGTGIVPPGQPRVPRAGRVPRRRTACVRTPTRWSAPTRTPR